MPTVARYPLPEKSLPKVTAAGRAGFVLTYLPLRLFRIQKMVILLLVIFSLVFKYCHHYITTQAIVTFDFLFNLDEEHNIPAFYSFLQLFIAGVLLLIVGSHAAGIKNKDARYWRLIAVIMFYIAVDELESIHERVGLFVHSYFHTSGALYFAWVIPAILLLGLLGLVLLNFLRRLPAPSRKRFLFAGIVYLTGALGGDLLGGLYISHHGDGLGWPYVLEYHIEETLEMIGIAYFINAVLLHIKTNVGDRVVFKSADQSS